MDYKYISKDTLNFISLHDCFIDNISFESNNLIWEMSHMFILAEHQFNKSNKHKCTVGGFIIFEHFTVLDVYKNYGIPFDIENQKAIGEVKKEPFQDIDKVETLSVIFKDLEILQFELLYEKEDFKTYNFLADNKKFFVEFTIQFRNIKICWNDYIKENGL